MPRKANRRLLCYDSNIVQTPPRFLWIAKIGVESEDHRPLHVRSGRCDPEPGIFEHLIVREAEFISESVGLQSTTRTWILTFRISIGKCLRGVCAKAGLEQ